LLRKLVIAAATGGAAALAVAVAPSMSAAAATPLSGAIFTTDVTGVPVNLNIYAEKADVYLNGGPGITAPDDAAGLPAGAYSFQVTDPSGKTLLSTDPVVCRQFTVNASGVIEGVVPAGGCEHATGADGEDGGATIQLFPYANTPNNGGVYKVWVSPTDLLDCTAPGNKNCFVPRYSKTDNFKVRRGVIVEIDTRFWKPGLAGPVDGLAATWVDTLGATNLKWSEYNPALNAFHEAHVEAVEAGVHQIQVADQAGCTIQDAQGPDGTAYTPVGGALTVPVSVAANINKTTTYWVDVHCVS
jgi:hypothetical protein